jgi:hypothetical protein
MAKALKADLDDFRWMLTAMSIRITVCGFRGKSPANPR